jgi:hypothetical protein
MLLRSASTLSVWCPNIESEHVRLQMYHKYEVVSPLTAKATTVLQHLSNGRSDIQANFTIQTGLGKIPVEEPSFYGLDFFYSSP